LRNGGFTSGMIAGAAIGGLIVLAMIPQVRVPMMDGAGEMGNQMGRRMRRMWRKGAHMAEEMIPEELQ
jgi:hypothetical protein